MSSVLDDWWPVLEQHWGIAQQKGMIGPGPLASQRSHAEQLAAFVDGRQGGVDLGTGAGLPGLVLAACFPDAPWLLVDASQRRCALVAGIITELGAGDRVTVRHGRAEELARSAERGRHGLVVARSFGPPAVVAECAVGLLAEGGSLVVSEPEGAGGTDRWPASGCASLGLRLVEERRDPVAVVRLARVGPLDDRWPRRPGMPTKRPLW